ncbi:MAG: hypothetical protein AAGB00_06205 [Planctomycetota bacterium]
MADAHSVLPRSARVHVAPAYASPGALLMIAVIVGAFFAAAPTAHAARMWTGADGQTMLATLVRVSDDTVVLNNQGKRVRVPLESLSEEDRKWVECQQKVRKLRDWTKRNDDVVRGRYLRYDEENDRVYIRTHAGEKSVRREDLCEDDIYLLNKTTDGAVPAPTDDRYTGSMAGGAPAEEDANDIGDEEPGAGVTRPVPSGWHKKYASRDEPRTWTDVRGKEITAEFRRMEGDRVILFMNDREYRVPLARLSATDRQLAIAFGQAEERADRLAGGAETDVAGTHAAGTEGTDEAGGLSEHEKIVARMRERARKRRAEREADLERRNNESVSRLDRLEQERKERERQREAERQERDAAYARVTAEREAHRNAARHAAPSFPTVGGHSGGAPNGRFESAGQPGSEYEYKCDSCNKSWTSTRDLGVGDKCPYCRVRFDKATDEHGNVTYDNSGSSTRRYRGIVRLVVWGVIGLASFVGWLAKQG